MRLSAYACSLLAVGLQALVEAKAFEPAGVWRGTLGGARIVACIEPTGGRYYYEAHRTSIPLEIEPGAVDWTEGDWTQHSGTWSGWRTEGDRLLASWIASGTSRKAISLQRVARLQPGESCEMAEALPDAYTEPRTRATQFMESEPKPAPVSSILGHADGMGSSMRVRSVVGLQNTSIRVFQIEADDPAARRINLQLRGLLDYSLQEHYECMSFGQQGEYDLEADELAFESNRWISIRTLTRATCGGPYPSVGVSVLTFDRRTGEQVDPIGWVGGNPVAEALRLKLLNVEFPSLTQQLDQSEEENCRSAWESEEYFNAWPSDTGMMFSPILPHVVQACGDDIGLAFSELAPHLTEEGRTALSR